MWCGRNAAEMARAPGGGALAQLITSKTPRDDLSGAQITASKATEPQERLFGGVILEHAGDLDQPVDGHAMTQRRERAGGVMAHRLGA